MGKNIKDLTGQRFGNLVAVSYTRENNKTLWKCNCDCGNTTIVEYSNLLRNTRSCGNCGYKAKVLSGRAIDLSGKRFGRLLVIELDHLDSRQGAYWKCLCDCGNKTVVMGGNLKNNHTTSCGCKKIGFIFMDLTGLRFGRLIVIKRVEDYISPKDSHTVMWLCKCDCGNEKTIAANSLRSGGTKSCGCIVKENSSKMLIDLTGQRFGKLFVIERAEDYIKKDGSHSVQWLCACDCGGSLITLGISLKQGYTKSCGCLSESWIATELKQYCTENYSAILEYDEIVNFDTDRYMPYDIFIPDGKFYIEVHGGQHYEYIPYFYENEKEFEYRQHKDQLKKEYAEQHGTYIEIDLRKIKTTEEAIKYVELFINK